MLSRSKLPVIIGAGILVAIISIFYIKVDKMNSTQPIAESSDLTLPDFSLANVLSPGEVVQRKDFFGKPLVLHVWASWCSSCAQESSVLTRLRQAHPTPLVTWVGVDFKDNLSNAQTWLQTHGNSLDVQLYDPNGTLSYALGILGTPETFLIDCAGNIVDRYRGAITEAYYQSDLLPRLEELAACAS